MIDREEVRKEIKEEVKKEMGRKIDLKNLTEEERKEIDKIGYGCMAIAFGLLILSILFWIIKG